MFGGLYSTHRNVVLLTVVLLQSLLKGVVPQPQRGRGTRFHRHLTSTNPIAAFDNFPPFTIVKDGAPG